MTLFKKKADPISDRARSLSDEIAALETQIKQLDSQLQEKHTHPRLRSTALPHGATISHSTEGAAQPATVPSAPAPAAHEPVFEVVDQHRLKAKNGEAAAPELYNELGVRKYDLPALLRRIRNHFRGPSTPNPKLVNYLAAGGIQGLRPMRYEKRVARNRFIAFTLFLLLILLGFILWIVKHH